MGLPRKLKHFALFHDGVSHVGEVPEVTLPKLARKTDDYRSGGMNMPIKSDHGMEAMEMDWTAAGFMRELFITWGAARHDAVLLRFVGALQRDDADTVDSIEVIVRGRHVELDPGTAKPAEQTAFKVKSAISYYKLLMNGETLIEIDAVNLVENVGGVDRLAEVRAILGV